MNFSYLNIQADSFGGIASPLNGLSANVDAMQKSPSSIVYNPWDLMDRKASGDWVAVSMDTVGAVYCTFYLNGQQITDPVLLSRGMIFPIKFDRLEWVGTATAGLVRIGYGTGQPPITTGAVPDARRTQIRLSLSDLGFVGLNPDGANARNLVWTTQVNEGYVVAHALGRANIPNTTANWSYLVLGTLTYQDNAGTFTKASFMPVLNLLTNATTVYSGQVLPWSFWCLYGKRTASGGTAGAVIVDDLIDLSVGNYYSRALVGI